MESFISTMFPQHNPPPLTASLKLKVELETLKFPSQYTPPPIVASLKLKVESEMLKFPSQ